MMAWVESRDFLLKNYDIKNLVKFSKKTNLFKFIINENKF